MFVSPRSPRAAHGELHLQKPNAQRVHAGACRLKRYIPPGAKPAVIELVLEALMHNTRVEVLYIQVLTLRRRTLPLPLTPRSESSLNTMAVPLLCTACEPRCHHRPDETARPHRRAWRWEAKRLTVRAMVGGCADDGRAQNFEHGFFDQQLESLMKVLKLRRIWGLNVGENFGVSIPAVRPRCRSFCPLTSPPTVSRLHLQSAVASASPISRPHHTCSKRQGFAAVGFRTVELSGGEKLGHERVEENFPPRAVESAVSSPFEQREPGVDGALTRGCAPQWRAFSDGLHETAVSHMYASEHHFRCVSIGSLRCMTVTPQAESQHAQTCRWVQR
jgi:hypothetical protein